MLTCRRFKLYEKFYAKQGFFVTLKVTGMKHTTLLETQVEKPYHASSLQSTGKSNVRQADG